MISGHESRSDREPIAGDETVVDQVPDRPSLDGDLTVYLREAPPEYVHDRQRAVLAVVDALETAGVLDGSRVVTWPKKVRDPADGRAAAALDVYREFVDAVGRRSLEPFFEEKAATGGADRVVVFPAICVAVRRDGRLAGLYPHWSDGDHHSVEDCLDALTDAEDVANVHP
jgi:hypothetical protein